MLVIGLREVIVVEGSRGESTQVDGKSLVFRPQQCDCAILPDQQDTGTPVNRSTVVLRAHVIIQSGKAAGVGLSAATTEAHVISGNIQDGPESRMLHMTRDPGALVCSAGPGQGCRTTWSLGPRAVKASCRCALHS